MSLRWQRLPAFKKLGQTLLNHIDGILCYLRSLIRRGRGYRDHEYLILNAQKSTAQARLIRAA